MLGYRKSKLFYPQENMGGPDIVSKIKRNILDLSGFCAWNQIQEGNFVEVDIIPDKERDLRYYQLYADTSPAKSFLIDGKIRCLLDVKNPPKELKLYWNCPENVSYPDIFNTLISYIPFGIFQTVTKIKNGAKRFNWVYNLEGEDRDTNFTVYPKCPLNYKKRLVISRFDLNGDLITLYSGSPIEALSIPVKFNLDTLEYDNFQLYLDWYNDKDEIVTEYYVTEFVKQDSPQLNYQYPVVDIDESYLSYFGKGYYWKRTDLKFGVTTLDYAGLLRESDVLLNISFRGIDPAKVSLSSLRVDGLVTSDLLVLDLGHKEYSLLIPASFTQTTQKEVILTLEYEFGRKQLTHHIDLTKLFKI